MMIDIKDLDPQLFIDSDNPRQVIYGLLAGPDIADKQEGILEGEMKARLENAKRMLRDGMEMSLVKKYTGLTLKALKNL